MTAAPAKPATRGKVPWDPWCWLEVQIATSVGSTGDPDRVGYWQPAAIPTGVLRDIPSWNVIASPPYTPWTGDPDDRLYAIDVNHTYAWNGTSWGDIGAGRLPPPNVPPDTTDPRYTAWQADGVAIPPSGGTIPAGYGEWVQGTTGRKWDADWTTISWRDVDCDLQSANFSTGSEPWDWNTSPGNGTLRLVDPDHTYFPGGPGSGFFDDIGVSTPIRVIANLTAAFDQVPANAANRYPYRVLITGLIRSIDHELTTEGTATTVVHFSEQHVVYGRVNRPATPVTAHNLNGRLTQIHNLSDDPLSGLMKPPMTLDFAWLPAYGESLQAVDIAADLWSEICKATNSTGRTTAVRLYRSDSSFGVSSPLVGAFIPMYPDSTDPAVSDHYGLDTRILTENCSAPDVTFNYTYPIVLPAPTDPPPWGNPSRVKIKMSPTGSITFGHDDSQMANVVSVAAVGGTETILSEQASIDRFYRHTYQRHDLVCTSADTPKIARRILDRLVQAAFHISDCDFYISNPRDYEFAVGAAPTQRARMDHPPVEPSRWIKLDWGWITADLRVTKISHAITPTGWTVTHSYEIHNPVTHTEVP